MAATKDETFVLSAYNNIPVTVLDAQGVTEDELSGWAPFQKWNTTLLASLALQSDPTHDFHADPYTLTSITIDSLTRFGARRIGVLKLTALVKPTHGGAPFLGTIFLRGSAVGMLVVLIPDDDAPGIDDAYTLLTVQPRIATGSLGFVELPAGMLDDSDSFAGTAAKEIEEELGLVIKANDLVCLTDRVVEMRDARRKLRAGGKENGGGGGGGGGGEEAKEVELPFAMYPSAGGCDEYIKIFAHEMRVSRAQIEEWEGKLTGWRDEGEAITLKVVPLEDLWREGGSTQVKKWQQEQTRQQQQANEGFWWWWRLLPSCLRGF